MIFRPVNRHLWIEQVEETLAKEAKSTILVPDDYNVPTSPYGTYKILKVSIDCEKLSKHDEEKTVIVNSSMVENVKFNGKIYYMISENYVYAIVE